ncbi:hypothetical protein I4F81_003219 [Pyropia yezoensis]|uniref:Uncharacterized protein n=1 Tax=Pyropia yezoensis TaxID=2788 RepID=A0ACC3BT48_PYRYE|nr:hypothetical protein I4F81_003219 [Neopyropia yezoensis]
MSILVRDPLLARMACMFMRHGEKTKSMAIIEEAVVELRRRHGVERPVEFIHSAVENAKPLVETIKWKSGGRAIQMPVPCRPARAESLALRLLRDSFRLRKEHGAGLRLAGELVDLSNKTGRTRTRRDDMHRSAEANKAYVYFRKA